MEEVTLWVGQRDARNATPLGTTISAEGGQTRGVRFMMSWRRKVTAGLAAAVVIGGATAGAVLTGTASAAKAPAARSHAASLTKVTLDYVPYANDSSLFLGIKRGMFRQHGLDVSLATAANPGVVISAMESGQDQFGFVTVVVAVNAVAHGTALKCVSSVDGNQTPDVAQDGTLLLANPSSGIKSVADLAGKTVATVQLASLNTLDVQEMTKQAGINPSSVHYVPMGFAEMPQALKQGTVQAAVIVAPFAEAAVAAGAKVIAHPNVVVMSNQATTCFASTDSYLAHHVKIADEFQAAMNEAIAYTKTHLDAAAATLPAHGLATNVKAAEQEKLGTNFVTTITPGSVAKTERLLERFGYIKPSQVPNPKSIIFPGA